MENGSALILLAHGSRAPETLKEMNTLAAKLRRNRKGLIVKPAFLTLIQPDLAQALTQVALLGAYEVHILPLFLFTGRHVLDDIPALIKKCRSSHKNLKLILHKPIGRHTGFADFLLMAGGLA